MKDLEQAILLQEKVALHANYLLESGLQNIPEPDNVEAFLSSFGSYKDLITDDCDTVEISRRVFHTVQEISQLASNLYKAATGFELPVRSFSSIGERQSDAYQSPKLPTRAETFGGFDERRMKQQQQQLIYLQQQPQQLPNPQWKDALVATIQNTISLHKDNQEKRDSFSWADTDSTSLTPTSNVTPINTLLGKDPNYDALQVSHHLHTLLCIINQQMTTISTLHAQLNSIRDNPKSMYRHNDQLEELRNLQGKLQEEKTAWSKQKEQQEKELEEQRVQQEALQKQIQIEQEDIRQQREGLYTKMQKLSNQGILLSPNVALSPNSIVCGDDAGHQPQHSTTTTDDHPDVGSGGASTEQRRKDKWISASSK